MSGRKVEVDEEENEEEGKRMTRSRKGYYRRKDEEKCGRTRRG